MSSGSFSPAHLDYMQRSGPFRPTFPEAVKSLKTIQLIAGLASRIRGVGRTRDEEADDARGRQQQPRFIASESIITSAYAAGAPLSFDLHGKGGSTHIHMGSWVSNEESGAPSATVRQQILEASLRGAYPAVELESPDHDFTEPSRAQLAALPIAGFALGVPSAKKLEEASDDLPIDHLLKAMTGMTWRCRILAIPVPENVLVAQRNVVIEELRRSELAAQAAASPSPLTSYYGELLSQRLNALTEALALGGWCTMVYLLGDAVSYRRLASVWPGVFSGSRSVSEPIRVVDATAALDLAMKWAIPMMPTSVPAPGAYRRTFEHQTLLSSPELAAYVHLPQVETAGFRVNSVARFDVEPPTQQLKRPIRLGNVIPGDSLFRPDVQVVSAFRDVDVDAFNKHAFVTGTTGSGKTRTLFSLLRKIAAFDVPFLVIEPAKAEYRELLNHPDISERLLVFTVGDENISPLRINPFEVLPGTAIGVHIDLIKSVFTASFGLWTPLPQILEECLQRIYEDRGWDIAGDYNWRTEDRTDAAAYPTLSDLVVKLDEVIPSYGFDPEAKGRVIGSLRSRLNGLRNGSKGRAFNVQRSTPMAVLMERPTILEIETLGDDDDKAFFMGLLLIRLFEYQRDKKTRSKAVTVEPTAQGKPSGKLKHVLVFEEAHRLLSNSPSRGDQGEANPRAKAVESFSNLISEVRAYGQGVIVVDQVPTKIAPDVIKNTNLKIVHRILDLGDREVMAGAMAMSKRQSDVLTMLPPFRAAVFGEGDDTPLLVHHLFDPSKDVAPCPSHGEVADVMRDRLQKLGLAHEAFESHPGCKASNRDERRACEAAARIVETQAFHHDFSRAVIEIVENPSSLKRVSSQLHSHIAANVPSNLEPTALGKHVAVSTGCLIGRAVEWFVSRRGAQEGWKYSAVTEMSRLLRDTFTAREGKVQTAAAEAFRNYYFQLHQRSMPPYASCERICAEARCLYRRAVAEITEQETWKAAWINSDPLNPPWVDEKKETPWAVCRRGAQALVTADQGDSIRRIGLCFGQLMLEKYGISMTLEQKQRIMDGVIDEATGQKGQI